MPVVYVQIVPFESNCDFCERIIVDENETLSVMFSYSTTQSKDRWKVKPQPKSSNFWHLCWKNRMRVCECERERDFVYKVSVSWRLEMFSKPLTVDTKWHR